jgi:aminopeptidase-like protein
MTPERPALNREQIGAGMYRLISELYPICRSITGNGFRKTLDVIRKQIPLEIHEVPSGTQVLDWTVPQEWNIRDAYIKNSKGERVVDFNRSNLHVVSYSAPVKARLSRAELIEHLFSDPDHPEWIPYRTSYYDTAWGFCVSHRQLQSLPEGEYDVRIDSTLAPGHLTYGECFFKGKISDEVLLSCHACHPSLCNDNLSGVALATFLARHLSDADRRYSYRVLFIPGTIGSISWLAQHEGDVFRIRHGLVLTGVGDSGRITYKKSRRGDAEVDRAALHVLRHSGDEFAIEEFSPYGYDERQYCSPAFNLPVGCLMRTPHGRYPEYHSSGDNLDFVHPSALADSFTKAVGIISTLEGNARFLNLHGRGEPQLGRRGLYGTIGGGSEGKTRQMAMLWVLNQSDGSHSLLDIAETSNIHFGAIREAADLLLQHGLLEQLADGTEPVS